LCSILVRYYEDIKSSIILFEIACGLKREGEEKQGKGSFTAKKEMFSK